MGSDRLFTVEGYVMQVVLLSHTPLEVADIAISKCYNKTPYTDITKQQARIDRVANVSKHSSTIEHLQYSFDIDGVSRALLQELARHRIASYTVKSTRYTLSELKQESYLMNDKAAASKYIVMTGNDDIDQYSMMSLENLRSAVVAGIPNDKAKYCLPECYKTALVWTINARALQNFLSLRSDKHALWEIQQLAYAIFEQLPEDHKFLFNQHMKDYND